MTTTDLLIHRPVVGCPPHIEEEIPMTIQFGLVGTDGIALVGDRRIYDDSGTTRTTFNGSKFRVNERQTIATAWARKGTGILVARAICKEMTDDCSAPEFALEEIATRVWDGLGLDQKSESHLLVVVSVKTLPGCRHNPGLAGPRVACDHTKIPRTLEGNGKTARGDEAAVLRRSAESVGAW